MLHVLQAKKMRSIIMRGTIWLVALMVNCALEEKNRNGDSNSTAFSFSFFFGNSVEFTS